MTALKSRIRPLAAALATVLLLTALPACGGDDDNGEEQAAGPDDISFQGANFTVGSKEFTEQLILGHITRIALEEAGANVNDQIGLAGSVAARRALTSGEIDLYWEYTGTGWITYLNETEPIAEREEMFKSVKEKDLEENDVVWLEPPAPGNNTYAVAVRGDADFEVENLSGLAEFVQENPDQATFCTNQEFAGRDDGLPGLQEHYDFEFSRDNVTQLDPGIIYRELGTGERCNFGVVFETDGRIQAQDLQVLEDDRGFFPNYSPALTVRQSVAQQNEQLEQFFAPIAEELTTERLQEMNAEVDVEGRTPEQVAEDFLKDIGFTD
jgi:osmoprotectant transport system substrate-binding protein